ncbi:hypothetical protein HMPREF3038_01774 [Akkermansia sp. KLE1797]|nr:hypothetical protein HMPREF3038_01774 [Akkermansia sp. KLE1797]KXU53980.1 hypothetical protein HMPREF3039_01935 [Akkermansia sp. KLE1798]KZA03158.1 hypothetical protein HMPREF1326_03202 [Akkermansia sp. KLE1605]
MTVGNELAGAGAGIAEPETVHDIIQTEFKELKQDVAGNAAAAGGFCIILAELAFKHAVLEAQLLLFSKHHAIVGLLFAACTHPVLTGREGALFKSLGGTEKGNAKTAGHFIAGTGITSHDILDL